MSHSHKSILPIGLVVTAGSAVDSSLPIRALAGATKPYYCYIAHVPAESAGRSAPLTTVFTSVRRGTTPTTLFLYTATYSCLAHLLVLRLQEYS